MYHKFWFYRINGDIDGWSNKWDNIIITNNQDGTSTHLCTHDNMFPMNFNVLTIDERSLIHNFGMYPAVQIHDMVVFAEYGISKKIEDLNISEEEKLILTLKYAYEGCSQGFHSYK